MSVRKYPRSKKSNKAYIVAISLILLLFTTVGITLAYIFTNTDPVVNTFTPVKTETEVIEDLGETKKNVGVKNNSDCTCYIRAKIVVSWVELDANKELTGNISGVKPIKNTDYTVDMGSENWVLRADGFYYYILPVPSGDTTQNLIDEAKLLETADAPENYNLSVEIIASSVQSEPAQAVQNAWGLNVDANGNLIITKQGE